MYILSLYLRPTYQLCRFENADLKMSLYVRVNIKITP